MRTGRRARLATPPIPVRLQLVYTTRTPTSLALAFSPKLDKMAYFRRLFADRAKMVCIWREAKQIRGKGCEIWGSSVNRGLVRRRVVENVRHGV
jgi:hypothetical protein